MSDNLTISYAFAGFTYLPLFLAYDLGYFPRDTDIKYADGDETALRSVLHLPNNKDIKSDFALCDPLIISNLPKLIGQRELGQMEFPIVVGSLIQSLPIWAFNPCPSILPVMREEELKGNISRVRCYGSPNTGYIVGLRILEKLGLTHDLEHLTECDFGKEFSGTIEDDELVLTSNMLRMGELGFNNKNIVYSYASRENDFQKMFFTGILTKKSLFSSELSMVLAILAGIKKAIGRILNDDIDTVTDLAFAAMQKPIADSDSNPFVTQDESLQRDIIKDALQTIVREENIYSATLELRKEEWEKAIALREGILKEWQPPQYEAYTDNIPVILIQDDWHSKVALRENNATTDTLSRRQPEPPVIHKGHQYLLVILSVGFLPFLQFMIEKLAFAFADGISPIEISVSSVTVLACVAALILTGTQVYWVFGKNTLKHFGPYLVWYVMLLGIPATFLAFLR